MKTRIISGIVVVALLVLMLVANSFWSPIAVIFLSVLAALASYEMLHNTGAVKSKAVLTSAIAYSALVQYAYADILPVPPVILTAAYALVIALLALRYHSNFERETVFASLSMPILFSYSFSTIQTLLNGEGFGLVYIVLLLNFSSIADCFAYFTGVAFGKHKLAPVISPKKTIEGAVGGVIGSVIGTVVICLIFNNILTGAKPNMLLLCLITPLMVVVGIVGDLFTSQIKRSYGIKDYGKLIPGHGGVIDRMDSVLFCAPVLLLLVKYLEVIS